MHKRRLTMKRNYPSNCLIVLYKTAMWSDMIATTTVNATRTKGIPLKTSGNEKMQVSACSIAKADSTNMKP